MNNNTDNTNNTLQLKDAKLLFNLYDLIPDDLAKEETSQRILTELGNLDIDIPDDLAKEETSQDILNKLNDLNIEIPTDTLAKEETSQRILTELGNLDIDIPDDIKMQLQEISDKLDKILNILNDSSTAEIQLIDNISYNEVSHDLTYSTKKINIANGVIKTIEDGDEEHVITTAVEETVASAVN